MSETIFLFRAMCKEELDLSLRFNSLQYFRNKEKCFSPWVDWIKSTVMNGKFNNSDSKSGRYTYLTCFCIPRSEEHKFRKHNLEWKTNVKKQVRINRIIALGKLRNVQN